jgi:Tfp pilus assembly protein PilN
VSRPLNLASRPFRNERLPALLFGLGLAALLALTVQHALTLARLRPGRGTPLEQEVARLEQETRRLRSEAASLRVPDPDPRAVPRWALLKELVDRRALRWTELLSAFEQALPGSVRLVSLAPEVKAGRVELELVLQARSSGEGLDVLRVLDERPEFDEVYPVSFELRDSGEQVRYSMRYVPAPAAPAEASSEPEAGQGEPGGEAAQDEAQDETKAGAQ